jgi:Tfp pilus assembly protein PilF
MLAAIGGVLGIAAFAGELELQARIDPAPTEAEVTLRGAGFPFLAETRSNEEGRFRFRKLDAGAYTVDVLAPGYGKIQRTVVVGPSLADPAGRVQVTIPFHPSAAAARRSLRERTTVSIQDLYIAPFARALHEKAQREFGKGDIESARRNLLRAVEVAPEYVDAWNTLGMIERQIGDHEMAATYFREAMKRDSTAYSPLVNLGGTLLLLNRYSEAFEYNAIAYSERPDDALANAQIGINFLGLGDEEEAVDYLRAAKELDPAHPTHPQIALALIYSKRGQEDLAIAEFDDFLRLHPDSPKAPEVRKWLKEVGGSDENGIVAGNPNLDPFCCVDGGGW